MGERGLLDGQFRLPVQLACTGVGGHGGDHDDARHVAVLSRGEQPFGPVDVHSPDRVSAGERKVVGGVHQKINIVQEPVAGDLAQVVTAPGRISGWDGANQAGDLRRLRARPPCARRRSRRRRLPRHGGSVGSRRELECG